MDKDIQGQILATLQDLLIFQMAGRGVPQDLVGQLEFIGPGV